MKSVAIVLCFLALAGTPAVAAKKAEAEVSPLAKVVQLLEGMVAKGKEEKLEEQKQFAAYKQWCVDFDTEKARSIKEAEQTINILTAQIGKDTADAAQLTAEVTELGGNIASWTADLESATKVRAMEKADYDKTHKDYSESVDALEKAINVLKKQAYDRKQSSFVQVEALKQLDLIPASAKKTIDLFLAQGMQDTMVAAAPEAVGYEFQSSGIIGMLEKLMDKFVDERTELEKEELNAKHAYELLKTDLDAQIKKATETSSDKSATKAAKLQSKAKATGSLKDTTATMAEDQKIKADTAATCSHKAGDFESRQALRTEELTAIEKAIEIISGGAVSKSSEKSRSFLQKKSALAHFRANTLNENQARMARFLQDRAEQLHSRVLSQVALRAAADPFMKVKKMLKDLVARLMAEAGEETEHKSWCDAELSANEVTRKEKTDAVSTLQAEVDELSATVAKLTDDIATIGLDLAEMEKAMAERTKIRLEEKAENAVTIKDAGDAQIAVAQAITVLKEFYEKAGEATSFVQQPAIFDAPYQGMASESGGVLGMLEVIESDFARLEADTKAAETSAASEYEEFMQDSKVDKATKEKSVEYKTSKKKDTEMAKAAAAKDLANTEKELDASLEYYEKLKPSCVDAGVSYEDRVARRQEEIESLQSALKILNGEELA